MNAATLNAALMEPTFRGKIITDIYNMKNCMLCCMQQTTNIYHMLLTISKSAYPVIHNDC